VKPGGHLHARGSQMAGPGPRSGRRAAGGGLWPQQHQHGHVHQRRRIDSSDGPLDRGDRRARDGGDGQIVHRGDEQIFHHGGEHVASSAGWRAGGCAARLICEPRSACDGLRASYREIAKACAERQASSGAGLRRSCKPRPGHATQSGTTSVRGTGERLANRPWPRKGTRARGLQRRVGRWTSTGASGDHGPWATAHGPQPPRDAYSASAASGSSSWPVSSSPA
jgi:hypothetical protein